MNWEVLRLLFIHELRMLLRARRTIVMSVVLPAVIMPVMLLSSKYTHDRRERSLTATTYKYAITGPLADRARKLIYETRQEVAESRDERLDQLRKFKAVEVNVTDPKESTEKNEIQIYVQTMTGEEADALPASEDAAGRPVIPGLPPPAKRLKSVPIVQVVYRGDRDPSDNAHDRMMELLRMARQKDSRILLIEHGFPGDPKDLFTVQDSNIATAGQITGSLVGRFITLFLVMLMFTGGAVAAIDIIAGEKERGTLETLLTTAAGRTEIVWAKQLAITSVGLVITLIQGLNFFLYIKLRVIELPKDFDLQLPSGMALTLLVLFIPLAATIASVLLMISAYAKSYKEASMYFFPVYLVSLIPSLASVMPGVSLRSAIAFVPLANVSVAAREILIGRPDAVMIFVTIGVMAFTAAYLMRTSARMLSREDIIVPSHYEAAEFLGGPALFQKRVIRWFAVMLAVEFAVAANIPQLATLRRQIFFNELVILIGATLLMLKAYRLDPREALLLKPVKAAVWPAILFAIPSGYITAIAVFRLASLVFPVPVQSVERFSQELMPKNIPFWQLLIYLSVLPGICEELAFRGMLLHGLRRKLRPAALVIAVGLIFGLFHVSLFRIAPTAALGMVLTAIALMTGSIFPGMLMHAGNNAFGIWLGVNSFSLEALSFWHYAAAIMIFALSMWIIYRNRTTPADAR